VWDYPHRVPHERGNLVGLSKIALKGHWTLNTAMSYLLDVEVRLSPAPKFLHIV
jgi:hypothetical protein